MPIYREAANRQDEDAPETEEPPHGLAGPPQRVERMRPVSHGKQGGRQSCEGQDLPPRALEQIAHEDRSSQNGQDGCEDPRDRTLRCAEKLSRQVQTRSCPTKAFLNGSSIRSGSSGGDTGPSKRSSCERPSSPCSMFPPSHVESRYEHDCPPTAGNSFPSHESVTSHAMMHAERAPPYRLDEE